MVLDTELTPELRAEGDAREIARAVQDLRREAGLELDDRIELWVVGAPPAVAAHLPAVAADTLAELATGEIPADAARGDRQARRRDRDHRAAAGGMTASPRPRAGPLAPVLRAWPPPSSSSTS